MPYREHVPRERVEVRHTERRIDARCRQLDSRLMSRSELKLPRLAEIHDVNFPCLHRHVAASMLRYVPVLGVQEVVGDAVLQCSLAYNVRALLSEPHQVSNFQLM